MKLKSIQGTYGSQQTPCNVFVATMPQGFSWYAVEDSRNVNATTETLENGVDVETLPDHDAFTWPDGVDSLDELERAINA